MTEDGSNGGNSEVPCEKHTYQENYVVALISESKRLQLVPYREHHVAKYHGWMQDEAMLEATASEAMSLKEEYAMQQVWRDDPKKITFILLLGDALVQELSKDRDVGDSEADRMVGDVNLFLHDPDDPTNAEIEVMVAEPTFRRLGVAREALLMLMRYGVHALGVTRYFAKIGTDNAPSLALFKTLGFVEVNYVAAFREHEVALVVDEQLVARLDGAASYTKVPYVVPH